MRSIINQNKVLNAETQTWIYAQPGTVGIGYFIFRITVIKLFLKSLKLKLKLKIKKKHYCINSGWCRTKQMFFEYYCYWPKITEFTDHL